MPSTELSRRALWRAAGIGGALALGASACGPNSGTSSGSDGSRGLRFSWWGNDDRAEVTERALEAFTAAHPEIPVAGEWGGFDGYFDKIATQVAGGGAPHAFQLNEWTLREYADRGALADLAEHGFSDAAWDPGANTSGQVDGKVFGASAGIGLQAVALNPAFFEEAGVEIPDDTTWTWQQYHELARELSQASAEGSYGTTYQAGDQITFGYAMAQLGAHLFDGETVAAGAAQAEEWFALWAAMTQDGTVPPPSESLENSTAEPGETLMGQGKAAMQILPVNLAVEYEKPLGAELRLLRIPTQSGHPQDLGMWYRPSMFYCASAQSDSPADATTLIDFLLNDPAAGKILLADRGVPPNAEIREAISAELPDAAARMVAYTEACAPDLAEAPEPPPVGAAGYPQILGRYAEDVLFGRTDPAAAAQGFLDELTAELA